MKRIVIASVPFLAAALILSGPAYATGKKVTCSQIRTELASGKTSAEVAKELKVSKKTVQQCSQQKTASTSKHSSHTHTAPAAPAQ
jgi:uncharacterized protein (DUF433 family)